MPPSPKVSRLRLGPAAELFVDREQFQRWELRAVFGRDRGPNGGGRTLGGDLLAFVAVKIFQIRLGDLRVPLRSTTLSTIGGPAFGQDALRRHHDFIFLGAGFLDGEEGLVFPGDQDVADGALREGDGPRRGRRCRARRHCCRGGPRSPASWPRSPPNLSSAQPQAAR